MAGAHTYESTTSVLAPPHRVWEVWRDVEKWHEWTASISSIELLDGATALEVGVRVRIRQPRLPEAVWTVTELTEGHHFTWTSSATGVTTEATHEVRAERTGAVAIAGIAQRGPLSGVVRLVMGRLVRRYLDLEAAGLRTRSEA
jgi:uncharacterized membrane protein